MAITLKRLAQSALSVELGLLYTVPAATTAVLKSITLANVTPEDRQVWLYIVPGGNSPAISNVLFPGITVPGYGVVEWTGLHVLNASDELHAQGDGLVLTASGVEQ